MTLNVETRILRGTYQAFSLNEKEMKTINKYLLGVSPLTYIVKLHSYFRHVHVDHLKKFDVPTTYNFKLVSILPQQRTINGEEKGTEK